MSDEKISRRGLFGLLRKDAAPKPPGFSLGTFYGHRNASSSDALPSFELRSGLPTTETSEVGTTHTPAAPPPWAVPAAHRIDGVVRVREYACLAHQGTSCSVCKERCPEERALVVRDGKPTVDPAHCTGCGACVGACPAPVNGFDIVPVRR
jgi:ferredoxin